jgi:hypothetical protein
MRRLVVLAIVSLLGIAPIGIVGRSASAQDSPTQQLANCSLIDYPPAVEDGENAPSLPWEAVCRPIAEDATLPAPHLQTMQPYAVAFKEEFAATELIGDGTEDQPMAEFMVVLVKEGSFALDLETDKQGNAQQVVVSTIQDHIETLTPWTSTKPHYSTPPPNGAPLTVNGEVCTRACPVDPNVPVLLMPGDFAVAEQGALCIYCLLNNNEGLLEVFVLLDDGVDPQEFTWIDSWDAAKDAWDAETATPSASTEPVVMAWAFFNPGRCDH